MDSRTHALVAMHIAQKQQGALSDSQLDALYGILEENSALDRTNYSIGNFKEDYRARNYEGLETMDLVSFPTAIKLQILALFKKKNASDSIQTSNQEADDQDLSLPILQSDAKESENPRSKKFLNRVKSLQNFLTSDAKDFSSLSNKIGDLSASLNNIRSNKIQPVEQEQISQHQVAVVQQPVVASPVRDTMEDPLVKTYDHEIATRMQKLHLVRQQLHEEKRQLFTVRKAVSDTIISIDDPRISHVVEELKKKEMELQEREELVSDQQSLLNETQAKYEKELATLTQKHRDMLSRITRLDAEKSAKERKLTELETESQKKEGQVYQTQQRLQSINRQVEEAQKVYNELNDQAQKLSNDISASRQDLELWNSELEDRENELAVQEKEARLRVQREREEMREEIVDIEQSYRNKLRLLEKKEMVLTSQQSDLQALRDELNKIKKQLEGDREDLAKREREFNNQTMQLEERKKALAVKERTLNDSSAKTLDYIDQKKRELESSTIQSQAGIDARLVELQQKETALMEKQQDLVLKEKELASLRNRHKHAESKALESRRDYKEKQDELAAQLASLQAYGAVSGVTSNNTQPEPTTVVQETPEPKAVAVPKQSTIAKRKTTSVPNTKNLLSELGVSIPSPSSSDLEDDFHVTSSLLNKINKAKELVATDSAQAQTLYDNLRSEYKNLNSNEKLKHYDALMELYALLSKADTGAGV